MSAIQINFDDALYKETGIREDSLTMRSADAPIGEAVYSLRVIKRNTGGNETLFISLYDPADMPVPDLKISLNQTTFQSDSVDHPETVAIPVNSDDAQSRLVLVSDAKGLHIDVLVKLEQSLNPQALSDPVAEDVSIAIKLLQQAVKTDTASLVSREACPSEELLLGYAYQELDQADMAAVASHIHICFDCLDIVLAARLSANNALSHQNIPLPAWLTDTTSETDAEVHSILSDLENKFGWLLQWPRQCCQDLTTEVALLMASFRPEFCPSIAADDRDMVTGKWCIRHHDEIQSIQPVKIGLENFDITDGNVLHLLGELDAAIAEKPDIRLYFGWRQPDDSIIPLSVEKITIASGRFAAELHSPDAPLLDDDECRLEILIVTD